MKRYCWLFAIAVTLFSCQGNSKRLKKSIDDEFSIASDVVIDGNDVIVVLQQVPQTELKSDYLRDYLYSSIVRNVLNTLGRSDFIEFTTVRIDVAPLKMSYSFPTKEYLLGIDKLTLISQIIDKLEASEVEARKIFDESITVELFEEQILKEWNDLEQWNGFAVEPKVVGVKVLQLSSEVEFFLQLGAIQVNKSGERALIEFLFESKSEKVLGLNITYL